MGLKSLYLSLISGLLFGAAASNAADTATAYINMDKVFSGFYKTKQAEESLKKQEDIYKERAKGEVAELEALKEKYDQLMKESQSVALNEESKQKKLTEAQDIKTRLIEKDQELKQYFNEKKREMQRDYLKSRDSVVKEIMAQVNAYADTKGYELVYDVSGMTQNMLPVILKYPKERDITEIILQELNRDQDVTPVTGDTPVDSGE
ncbi:MAG: OmpH family outer membrane protein [Lentisphaeria bacterium]|nr:OmpH family outer membrane protein [Lentisphaeria bacterium]